MRRRKNRCTDTIAQVLNAICVMCPDEAHAGCEKCASFFCVVCWLLCTARTNANIRRPHIRTNVALVIRLVLFTHSLFWLRNFNSARAFRHYLFCSTFIQLCLRIHTAPHATPENRHNFLNLFSHHFHSNFARFLFSDRDSRVRAQAVRFSPSG